MKFVILLALVAFAAAQREDLNHLINVEVHDIIENGGDAITAEQCTTFCDARFDLSGGHDEEITDRLCEMDCARQLHMGPGARTTTAPPA